MTQEEKIYKLENKVNMLEERNIKLTKALSGTIRILSRVTHMANNTYYDYSQEESELIAELSRLSCLL